MNEVKNLEAKQEAAGRIVDEWCVQGGIIADQRKALEALWGVTSNYSGMIDEETKSKYWLRLNGMFESCTTLDEFIAKIKEIDNANLR